MTLEPGLTRAVQLGGDKSRPSDGIAPASADRTAPAPRINNLHHHAFFSSNSEATRRFYEDVLGLPLTMAVRMNDDIEFFKGEYLHTFFALADGSSIAFFEYPELWKEQSPALRNRFEHHLALQVESDSVLEHYRDRLSEHGVKSMLIDHHVYKSLAFEDPDGLNLELLSNTPSTAEFEAEARRTAHADLDAWTNRSADAASDAVA